MGVTHVETFPRNAEDLGVKIVCQETVGVGGEIQQRTGSEKTGKSLSSGGEACMAGARWARSRRDKGRGVRSQRASSAT